MTKPVPPTPSRSWSWDTGEGICIGVFQEPNEEPTVRIATSEGRTLKSENHPAEGLNVIISTLTEARDLLVKLSSECIAAEDTPKDLGVFNE